MRFRVNKAGTVTFGGVLNDDNWSVSWAATATLTEAMTTVVGPTGATPTTKLRWEREIAAILLR